MSRLLRLVLVFLLIAEPAWAGFWANGSTPVIMLKMIDSADHISAKTGLTVTCKMSKAGGTTINATSNSVAEIDATNHPGWYKVTLSASETNTNGDISFRCTATGADDTDFRESIVAFDPTNAQTLGLSALPAHTTTETGGLATVTSANNLAGTPTVNTTQIAGASVNTSLAQLGVNVVTGNSHTFTENGGLATVTSTNNLAGNVNVNVVTANSHTFTETGALATVTTTNNLSGIVQANAVTVGGKTTTETGGPATVTVANNISGTPTVNTTQIAGANVNTSSAQLGVNLVNIAGSAVSTSSAQLGVNVVQGNAHTFTEAGGIATVTAANNLANLAVDTNGAIKIQAALKRNVAFSGFQFLTTDPTTHNPVTLAGTGFTCTRSIDGAGFVAGTLSTGTVSNGVQTVSGQAADVNGGNIMFRCTGANSSSDDSFFQIITYP